MLIRKPLAARAITGHALFQRLTWIKHHRLGKAAATLCPNKFWNKVQLVPMRSTTLLLSKARKVITTEAIDGNAQT